MAEKKNQGSPVTRNRYNSFVFKPGVNTLNLTKPCSSDHLQADRLQTQDFEENLEMLSEELSSVSSAVTEQRTPTPPQPLSPQIVIRRTSYKTAKMALADDAFVA